MKQIEFFYDFASPYSYLASTRMEGLEKRTGAPVIWRPFALGHVFKEAGNAMTASIPAKAKYMITDLKRWAEFYQVPFQWPSLFPLRSVPALRAALAAEELGQFLQLSAALFQAYWTEGQDLSQTTVLQKIADSLGLPGAKIAARIEDQAIKDKLRANTEEAVRRGAFGAPTFFVGEEMFWGNDRIEMVERFLQGRKA
ncbi:MAG: 2-hydroxychromene-2-carboxylate isomerase [Deltaproteobacteria bacterium RBG_13_61_14]|nr:MAG: 2-hydroxychromene-2-carboxylate isomerase [Deltaproteobacteria bacterium RBG_13_61_14]